MLKVNILILKKLIKKKQTKLCINVSTNILTGMFFVSTEIVKNLSSLFFFLLFSSSSPSFLFPSFHSPPSILLLLSLSCTPDTCMYHASPLTDLHTRHTHVSCFSSHRPAHKTHACIMLLLTQTCTQDTR